MSWYYHNEIFTEEQIGTYTGYIYLITELDTGKRYVGQKVFFNKVSKKPLKGKKNRRISKKYSDWQDYFGSNEELKQAVIDKGRDNYRREIIHLCKAKSEMNYLELYEIVTRHALLSEDYFNSWVSTRINKNQLKSFGVERFAQV